MAGYNYECMVYAKFPLVVDETFVQQVEFNISIL